MDERPSSFRKPGFLKELFPSLRSFSGFGIFLFLILVSLYAQISHAEDVSPASPEKGPVDLKADHLEFLQESQTYIANGSVSIIQGEKKITGDHLIFKTRTGDLDLKGNVQIQDKLSLIRSDHLNLNLNDQTGRIENAHLVFGPERYHLDGKLIEKKGPSEYHGADAIVTTCECNRYEPAGESVVPWRFKVSDLVVHLDQSLTARNAIFEIRNVPVFYTPYLYLPIIKDRQSGLLIPKIEYNSLDGMMIQQPVYFTLGRSQDLTLTADYRSLRGEGAELEYRYAASASANGNLWTQYFHDDITQQDRAEIKFNHSQSFSDKVDTRMSLNYVSDPNFFKDLSVVTDERSQRSVESNILVTARGENQTAYFLSRYTQDLTTDNSLTIQKLPEIGYTWHSTPFLPLPLYFDFNSTADYFYSEQGIKAGRSDSYLHLMYELPVLHLGILTPRAGVRRTFYSRNAFSDAGVDRTMTDLGAGFDSSISKKYGGDDPVTHVIESSLVYEYVPPVDQSNIPQFDTIDYIPDKDSFTYALTNRFIRGREEFFYLKFTDSYLVNSTTEAKFSDLRSEMAIRRGWVKLKTDSYYNFYTGMMEIFNFDFQTEKPKLGMLSIGERFTHDGLIPRKGDIFNPLSLGVLQSQPVPIRFATALGRFTYFDPWSAAAKFYYDYDNKIMIEADYGIRYLSDCWGISLGYIQFPNESQFSFLVTLKGIGSGGSDIFKTLFGS